MGKLTSEIEKRKQIIENEFLIAVSTLPNIEEMEQELLRLQDELQQIEVQANVEVNSSFVFKLFKRREYNEQVENKTKASKEVRRLKKEINQLKSRINSTKSTIEVLKQEKEESMAKYDCSKERLVEICISENPELLKDGEFLKSCIDIDLANICLVGDIDDKVADDVYAYFAECYEYVYVDEEKMKGMGYTDKEIQIRRGAIEYVISELRNPSEVPEGTYKIPHKFLRESILNQYSIVDQSVTRKNYSALDITLNDECVVLNNEDFFDRIAASYARFDGKLPLEYGQELEQLYSDKSKYIYLHSVGYKGEFKGDDRIDVCQSICENGLKLPAIGNEFGKPRHTTLNTDTDRASTLLDFLDYWSIDAGVAVLQVPKEIVDENRGYIGWKLGFDGKYEREELYMLPEYVVGYTSYGKFIKNPIPLDKRVAQRSDMFYKITTDAHRTNIDSHRSK